MGLLPKLNEFVNMLSEEELMHFSKAQKNIVWSGSGQRFYSWPNEASPSASGGDQIVFDSSCLSNANYGPEQVKTYLRYAAPRFVSKMESASA